MKTVAAAGGRLSRHSGASNKDAGKKDEMASKLRQMEERMKVI